MKKLILSAMLLVTLRANAGSRYDDNTLVATGGYVCGTKLDLTKDPNWGGLTIYLCKEKNTKFNSDLKASGTMTEVRVPADNLALLQMIYTIVSEGQKNQDEVSLVGTYVSSGDYLKFSQLFGLKLNN